MVVFSLLLANPLLETHPNNVREKVSHPCRGVRHTSKQTFSKPTHTNDPCRGFIFQLILVYTHKRCSILTLQKLIGEKKINNFFFCCTLKYYIMRLKRCKQMRSAQKERTEKADWVYRFDYDFFSSFSLAKKKVFCFDGDAGRIAGCQSIWAHIRFKGVVKF